MRVLDLGSGLGHVARLAGELVGPAGSVLGIDQSNDALAVARDRTKRAGMSHVDFAEGDVTAWRTSEPVDAVVGRLLLFHVADPAAVARHHIGNLRPGGVFVAIDFDIGASRSEPPVALVEETLSLVQKAFRAAGAWPRIGARLGVLLTAVVRSLAPAIIRHGIATAEQLDLETLEARLVEAVQRANAVILLPTVAGAWGYAPDAPRPGAPR